MFNSVDEHICVALVTSPEGLFMTADGSYKYIYHAHASMTSIAPRTSYINDLTISDN
jgi:hypothetical protein